MACLAASTTIPLPSKRAAHTVPNVIVVPAPKPAAPATAVVDALVIDRQPLFLAALANLLEAPPLEAKVVTASRSDVGLDLALSGDFDLVFCELDAEPVSGLGLVEALGKEHRDVPVVLLGDDGDESQLAAALSANVAGAFTKSSDVEEFLVGVRAIVAGHRAIGAGLLGRLLERAPQSVVQPRDATGRLSPTELAILAMIGQAQSIPSIAASRGISHKTVRNHLAKIYRKLELHGRTEAMLWAARMGLTEA